MWQESLFRLRESAVRSTKTQRRQKVASGIRLDPELCVARLALSQQKRKKYIILDIEFCFVLHFVLLLSMREHLSDETVF